MAQRHHDRAEALDYEPSKVHGSNARQKGVEATHEPLPPPLTCVLSPEAGERLGERCCSKIVAGRNWNDSKGTVLLSWSWAIMNAASRSGM